MTKHLTPETLHLAKTLWEYHHMNHTLETSDCIFVLGSHDIRVADRAVELYFSGYAPYIIFSGGRGKLTETWEKPEAEVFGDRALSLGVPQERIILEAESTNTGENVIFTERLIRARGLHFTRLILIQKPYMERRTYATFMKHFPEKHITVTSPQIPFEKYATPEIPLEYVISIMVGDLERIRDYPGKGFQIYQEIPEHVTEAYERLIALGYTTHSIKQ